MASEITPENSQNNDEAFLRELITKIGPLRERGLTGLEIFNELRGQGYDYKATAVALKYTGYAIIKESFSAEVWALQISKTPIDPKIPWEMQHFMGMVELETWVYDSNEPKPPRIVDGN